MPGRDASRTTRILDRELDLHRRLDAVASNEVSDSLNVRLGSLREPVRLAHARVFDRAVKRCVMRAIAAGPSTSLDWMRTGITDMVVTDLSQSQQVEVVSTEHLYGLLAETRRRRGLGGRAQGGHGAGGLHRPESAISRRHGAGH
jgi:hypothetical protein